MSGHAGWVWHPVLAHRCGGALAPENTLAGLEIAARLGCRAVEFDVMLSRDGVPVLIHDETLERTTGVIGRVVDSDAAYLQGLDAGSSHHPAFWGEPIPRLDEALARCCRLGLAANVEIKPATGFEAETGEVVGRLVAAADKSMLSPILFSSFSEVALRAAARHAGFIPRGLLVQRLAPSDLVLARDLSCVSLNLSARTLAGEDVLAIRAAGLKTLVYTVNQENEGARLFGLGVDGIFTDRPELFLPQGRSLPASSGQVVDGPA